MDHQINRNKSDRVAKEPANNDPVSSASLGFSFLTSEEVNVFQWERHLRTGEMGKSVLTKQA